ncbi:hypothetical protein JZU71_01800, partial [bacterium]|nr:hypothetical protein [bacterium]
GSSMAGGLVAKNISGNLIHLFVDDCPRPTLGEFFRTLGLEQSPVSDHFNVIDKVIHSLRNWGAYDTLG